jgi:hypothetical protein
LDEREVAGGGGGAPPALTHLLHDAVLLESDDREHEGQFRYSAAKHSSTVQRRLTRPCFYWLARARRLG